MVKGRYQGQGCILAKNKFLLSSGKTHVNFSGQFKHKPGSQLPKMRLKTFLLLCLVVSIYALPRGGGRGGGGRGAGVTTFQKITFFFKI